MTADQFYQCEQCGGTTTPTVGSTVNGRRLCFTCAQRSTSVASNHCDTSELRGIAGTIEQGGWHIAALKVLDAAGEIEGLRAGIIDAMKMARDGDDDGFVVARLAEALSGAPSTAVETTSNPAGPWAPFPYDPAKDGALLGYATTEQLIEELAARARLGGYAAYRTVDGGTSALKAAAPPCGCTDAQADKCRRGDMMMVCGCECHGKAVTGPYQCGAEGCTGHGAPNRFCITGHEPRPGEPPPP